MAEYVEVLAAEIKQTTDKLTDRSTLHTIFWGGGLPPSYRGQRWIGF